MDHQILVKNMVETSHELYSKGLVPGKSGNISVKFQKNGLSVVAVTPSGSSFKTLKKSDIVLVDLNGDVLSKTNQIPTSELEMHLKIYKLRDDVGAVVHTHSPITTGFAFSDEKIKRFEGFGPIEEEFIKTVDYHPPGSSDLAMAVSEGLLNQDVVVLKNHGMVAVGQNLEEATLLAEFVEDSSKIQFVKKILMSN
jgi:L-fuculose-phosphate aldolase